MNWKIEMICLGKLGWFGNGGRRGGWLRVLGDKDESILVDNIYLFYNPYLSLITKKSIVAMTDNSKNRYLFSLIRLKP